MSDEEHAPSPTVVMPRLPLELGPVDGHQLPAAEARQVLAELDEQMQIFEGASIAKNTQDAYYFDLLDYYWWCHRLGLVPLPADESTILRYLTDCGTNRTFLFRRNKRLRLVQRQLKYSSIERRLAAIRFLHRHSGHPHHMLGRSHPATERLLKGIARTLGRRPEGKKGLSLEQIQRMIHWIRARNHRTYSEELQDELNIRDEAIVLMACATGRRRSELVALNVEDLTFEADVGVDILIRRSKTDQEGKGQMVYMAVLDSQYCPVRALGQHLGARQRGPVFTRLDHAAQRSQYTGETPRIHPRTIATVIKQSVKGIGLDPKRYGGHSTRKAMATLAGNRGASIRDIQATGGWQSIAGVNPYLEAGDRRKNAVTSKVLG